MLVARRLLCDPVSIADANGVSYVAAPTYAHPEDTKKKPGDASYVTAQFMETPEGRREVVGIDSKQSGANRVESGLAHIFSSDPTLPYPRVSIPFPGGPTLDNWDMPHRSADQALRLTNYYVDQLRRLKGRYAFIDPYKDLTWFLEHFPIDVILGVWHVHKGPKVTLPRLLTATMMGYAPVQTGENSISNRILSGAVKKDPLIGRSAKVLRRATPDGPFPEEISGFDFTKSGDDKTSLSSAGLGDIAGSVKAGNVFALEYVEQRVSLALEPLYTARFPDKDGRTTPERDAAGREVLIALAKIAFQSALEIGGMLRSGCLLVPIPGRTTVLEVKRDGTDVPHQSADMDALLLAYRAAMSEAQRQGFTFSEVVATPNAELIKLYNNRGKHYNDAVDSEAAGGESAA